MQRYIHNHSAHSRSYYPSSKYPTSSSFVRNSPLKNSPITHSYHSFPLAQASGQGGLETFRRNELTAKSLVQSPFRQGVHGQGNLEKENMNQLSPTIKYAEAVYGLNHLPKMLLPNSPFSRNQPQHANSQTRLFRSNTPAGNTVSQQTLLEKGSESLRKEKTIPKNPYLEENEKGRKETSAKMREERGRILAQEKSKTPHDQNPRESPIADRANYLSSHPNLRQTAEKHDYSSREPIRHILKEGRATPKQWNLKKQCTNNYSTNELRPPFCVPSQLRYPGLSGNYQDRNQIGGWTMPYPVMIGIPTKMDCVIKPENGKGGLFVGSFEGAKDIKSLRLNRISAVLTASGSSIMKYLSNDVFMHKVILAQDIETYDLTKHFKEAFDFIDQARASTNVLVHCFAGVSRSVTLVVAYLMVKYHWSMSKALDHVRQKRSVAQPNPGFLKQLRKFETERIGEVDRIKNVSLSSVALRKVQ